MLNFFQTHPVAPVWLQAKSNVYTWKPMNEPLILKKKKKKKKKNNNLYISRISFISPHM